MVSACKGCPSFDGQSSSPFRCARFGILFPDTWIGNYYDLAIDSSFFREAAQRCNNVRLLCLPKTLSGANTFEINDIKEDETEASLVR